MWIMAAGALIGGADRIFGNRLGLGRKFEEGFLLMGSTALSMAGIIRLVPLLSRLLGALGAKLLAPLGIDPAMLAGILAIDMGGYQLATELAANPLVGRFSGIVVGAILGCTVTFTIPIGMGMLDDDSRPDFARGILFGLISMPVALILGGVVCGLGLVTALWQSLPVAELMQRALKKPLAWMQRATGMNSASAAGLLIGMVSVLPAIALVKDMDRRGRIVNAAFMVCAASCFAAHLGFTVGVDAAMLPALLASKLFGGAIGAGLALTATRKK